MTDNEKLIEEAAEAIAREWRNVRSHEDMARAALAVFEKAHTPTDDERKVIESIKLAGNLAAQVMMFQGDSYPVKAIPYTSFLHILDGFRRSDPQPSGPWDLPTSCFGHCDKEGWYSECVSKKDDAELAEPQGEPSDAEIEAAARSWVMNGGAATWDNAAPHVRDNAIRRMREALRAARGASDG